MGCIMEVVPGGLVVRLTNTYSTAPQAPRQLDDNVKYLTVLEFNNFMQGLLQPLQHPMTAAQAASALEDVARAPPVQLLNQIDTLRAHVATLTTHLGLLQANPPVQPGQHEDQRNPIRR